MTVDKSIMSSTKSASSTADLPKSNARFQTLLCFMGLLLMNLVVAIDATALGVALPAISKDINASFATVYYTGIAFLLAWTVCQPLFASLASLSRRMTIVAAVVFFMTGIIMSAVAKRPWSLILGRTIQGVGGGGILALTYILMADLFTIEERAKYVSFLTLVYLIGTVSGPVVGGGLAYRASWRWIFWLQIPLTIIAFVLVTIYTRSSKLPLAKKDVLSRIDWLGMVGFAVGTTLFLVVLSSSGVSWTWHNWKTPTGLVVAAAILVVALTLSYRRQTSTGITSLFPPIIFSDRTAAINLFSTFSQGIMQCAIVYYLPLFFQIAKPISPLKAGLLLLPSCGISSITTITTGIVVSRTKKIRVYTLVGWSLFTFGQIPLSAGVLKAEYSIASWILLNVCQAIGNGILIVTCTLAVQASAEYRTSVAAEDRARVKAMAAALNPFFRALGNTVGVVVGAVTVSNELRRRIGEKQSSSILTIVNTLHQSGGGNQTLLIEAAVKSLNVLWLILNILAAINLVLCYFTKDFAFSRPEEPRKRLSTDTEAGVVEIPSTDKSINVAENEQN